MMTKHKIMLALLSGTALGCSAGTPLASGPASAPLYVNRVHTMPTRHATPRILRRAAPAGAQLTYFGGPVLQNVNVVPVLWGAQVAFASQLTGFYGAAAGSAYFDWLTEYSTTAPGQTIGHGSATQPITDQAPPSASDDSDLQTELARLIDAGTVPAPDSNTLYALHFPAGITITQGGQTSCVDFCAYHGTFVKNGLDVFYSVMPDQGGACAGGCGTDTDAFRNTTMVASHELGEAVTDAAVGIATGNAAPLAWYDQTNGEIGDICVGQKGSAAGYAVQLLWSNQENACIDHRTGG